MKNALFDMWYFADYLSGISSKKRKNGTLRRLRVRHMVGSRVVPRNDFVPCVKISEMELFMQGFSLWQIKIGRKTYIPNGYKMNKSNKFGCKHIRIRY